MACRSGIVGAANVLIGDVEFYALLEGTLSPPQPGLVRTEEPYENGFGYLELGRKAREDTLILAADFDTGLEAKDALIAYAAMKLQTYDIQIRIGPDWVTYECYQVLEVRDITRHYYAKVASGGLRCGNVDLVTQWTVQQANGIWLPSIGFSSE
jgi:hypothetical protein